MTRLDEVNKIKIIVAEAEELKNIDKIKDCLFNPSFKELDQFNVERLIFQETVMFINYRKINEKILNYLIFEYNISEKSSINTIDKELLDVEKAEKMFKIRNARDELNSELVDNDKNPTKKIKI